MDTVMSPRPPIWMPRWHYICRQMNYDWRRNLPEGFTVQRMQIEMLEQGDLDLPNDVRTTLEKWAAAKSEQFADYGFVTIDQTGAAANHRRLGNCGFCRPWNGRPGFLHAARLPPQRVGHDRRRGCPGIWHHQWPFPNQLDL